jgi:glycosyltransferase involved in cell wall biosynthesis
MLGLCRICCQTKDVDLKFLLYSGSFSERGDSVTIISLAHLIKKQLGHDVVICIPGTSSHVSNKRIEEAKSQGIEVVRFSKKSDLDSFAVEQGITHTYVFSGGTRSSLPYFDPADEESFRIAKTKHITHVVFRNYDIHGDAYLYVSDWLFKSARPRLLLKNLFSKLDPKTALWTPKVIDAFPHFVETSTLLGRGLPLRNRLGIPAEAKVLGRIGGFSEFSDPAARQAVKKILDLSEKNFAIFVNTKEYFSHPRAFFLPALSRQDVAEFYGACDVLINGRRMGETFGYSIVEPLLLDKPVIAPHWIRNPIMDKHHISVLKGTGLLYFGTNHLVEIFKRLNTSTISAGSYAKLASEFTPERAAAKLQNVIEII